MRGQQTFVFRTWGGKRPGAGRRPRGPRASERHRKRPEHAEKNPLHVTVRVAEDIRGLRTRAFMDLLQEALCVVMKRLDDFRICQISVQGRHLHLVVEATDERALARGMQAFLISAAKRLNHALGRKGAVFVDRYHAVAITNPTQCRNVLGYVFNNWRHHDEDRWLPGVRFDPFSSAATFGGWAGAAEVLHLRAGVTWLPVARARTWLLRTGWRARGLLDPWRRPS